MVLLSVLAPLRGCKSLSALLDGPRLLLAGLLCAESVAGVAWLALDRFPPLWDEAVQLDNSLAYCSLRGLKNPLEYLSASTYYPPGVPWSACPFYSLLGRHPDAARLAGLAFLVGIMAGAYLLTVRLSADRWAGALAAFFVGTYPIAFGEARLFLPDVPTTFWVMVVLVLLIFRTEIPPLKWGALLGLSVGIGLLTHWRFPLYVGLPILIVFGQIVFGTGPEQSQPRRAWVGGAILSLIVSLAIAAPWYGPVLGDLMPELESAEKAGVLEGDPAVMSWQSLVWYPLSFFSQQLGLAAAAISSTVMISMLWSSLARPPALFRLGWWTGFRLLVLSLVPTLIILTYLANKDPRYTMPLLVPVAVITACGLARAFRLGPQMRCAGLALVGVSVLNGVFLMTSVSFAGVPAKPILLEFGKQRLVFAASQYHLARSPGRLGCSQPEVVRTLAQIDGRRPVVGILSDSNTWNSLNLPYWAQWNTGAHRLVPLFPGNSIHGYDALILGGRWFERSPPFYYQKAGACTSPDGSMVGFYVSPGFDSGLSVNLGSSSQTTPLGSWRTLHAVPNSEEGKIASSSVAGPKEWAETSYLFSAPVDMALGPGIRVRWRLSSSDAKSFWIFLEDIHGNKLVWDRTAALKSAEMPVAENLIWADADVHYAVSRAFDFAGVKRLSFSILEPAVPVHPTLVLDMAAVALPGCANATSISPPAPPAGTSGGFIKHWYMCNRAELAVVYSGEKDTDPTVHYSWAQQFEDRPLYSEIMLLREALSSGVRGSADRPFEAFLKWKSAQGK